MTTKAQYVVAVWLANFNHDKDLEDYLMIRYDEDGRRQSNFGNAVGLAHFDIDFLEHTSFNHEMNPEEIVDGVSFSDYFKDDLTTMINHDTLYDNNTIIFLYGKQDVYGTINEHIFSLANTPHKQVPFSFIGTIKFEIGDQ
ncbi:immunity 22 family protein [Chitinophaga rhizophila]|uniref:Immunity 22 family protein n=1 Tax=Chitinophaga rhizophila TaxID=2866212 RepID=A0ABS7G6X4_9BACT|nr:immunity 22 family protein [Chitinophaga rhizophila]MBW8683389.1 immunity 22 family protein [Chitinophaga rhizophila]